MDKEERRDTSGEHREDPQDFENISREVREGQSSSIGEEGTEEDRRQWKKTRALHEEATHITHITEKADQSHRKAEEENRDHSEG